MVEPKLQPCPFCAGPGDIESRPSYSQAANTYFAYRGWCDSCGFGLDWHNHETDAIAAWNERPALSAENAKLKGALEWQDIETAPRDGTMFLATVMVSNIHNEKWRETHLIWCDDETGTINSEAYQGWDVDDYAHWLPLAPLLAALKEPRS